MGLCQVKLLNNMIILVNVDDYVGLVTFSDGGHGLPRHEGTFDCGKLVTASQCSSQVNKAQEAAAAARKHLD